MIAPTRRRFGGALLGAATLAALSVRAAQPAARTPTTHHVTIEAFKFAPTTLTVHPGDQVHWTNHDLAPHTATDATGAWGTGEIGRGETGTVTLTRPGRYAYACAYHPHMRGVVVVKS